jgi:hypothetical protein
LIGRLAFGMGKLRQQDGFFLGGLVSGLAFGLERFQLIAGFFDGAFDFMGRSQRCGSAL